MFKPSLKRSKIEQIQLYTKRYQPPHNQHSTIKQSKPLRTKYSQQSSFIPTSFYEPYQLTQKIPNPIFSPLNYQWQPYAECIKKQLDFQYQMQQVKGRGIGCYKDIIWYFQNKAMTIWNMKTGAEKRFELPGISECISIGELQSGSLHFKTSQQYILAFGITNCLFLFGIQKETLNKSDLKFNHTIINSRYIQKIKFLNKNQIVVASDTGYYYHFDFNSQVSVSSHKLPVLQRVLPFLPLLYPSSTSYIEKIQISGSYIYSLVRQEKPANWFSIKAKQLLNKVLKEGKAPEYIIQRRRIQVYEIDKENKRVKMIHKLSQQQLRIKLKANNPELELLQDQDSDSLKIKSIYIDKRNEKSQGFLGIVLQCGYFVTINKGEHLIFAKNHYVAPRQNNIGVVGYLVQKKPNKNEQFTQANIIKYSLGLQNLTIMNDSIWYFGENAIQSVKCQSILYEIYEIEKEELQPRKWVVFTKQGFYIVKRLQHRQIFLSYLSTRQQMLQKQPQNSWSDQTNFYLFLQNMSKIIGSQKICQLLIECLLQNRIHIKLNKYLFKMIRDQLKGIPLKDYRDWQYDLNTANIAQNVDISQSLKNQLWRYLIQFEHKRPKQQMANIKGRKINCNAYWYALRKVFIRYTSNLLEIQSKTIKPNRMRIQKAVLKLQEIQNFFAIKRQKEDIIRQHFMGNRIKNKDTQQMRGFEERIKQKSHAKMEENTQISLQNSLPYSSTNINQSTIKLENIIQSSIEKLKTIITILFYLADLNQNENLPNLLQILKSRKQRIHIKKYLIERVNDVDKLKQFSKGFPELQLENDLRFMKWYQYQKDNKMLEMSNLPEIASFLSSEHLQKVKKVFQGHFDLLVDLMLLNWDYLSSELDHLMKRHILQSQKEQIFSIERCDFVTEKKQFLLSEMQIIEQEVKNCITAAIKTYVYSDQSKYDRAQKMINNIVKIVASHDQKNMNSFLQSEMVNFGLSQKIFLLRKYSKKSIPQPKSLEILSKTQVSDAKKSKTRQNYSSTDVYQL